MQIKLVSKQHTNPDALVNCHFEGAEEIPLSMDVALPKEDADQLSEGGIFVLDIKPYTGQQSQPPVSEGDGKVEGGTPTPETG